MTDYGDVDIIRTLTGIEAGEQEERIGKLMKLANVWLTSFMPEAVLNSLSVNVKDTVVNYYTTHLIRITAERYTGDVTEFADTWEIKAEKLLKSAMLQIAEIFDFDKVNE